MPGLLRGIARTAVVAGTATAVSNRVSRRQAGRWAEQDAWAAERVAPAPAPAAAPPAEDDTVAQLRQLGDLRDRGVLSDEEFAAAKRRVLGA
ncbi:SHOCT domain-containing protein [Actinomycetospora chiangmaiensis]|uniref:SHOCT domain-containing protein n=1 Tax=Actinomycetospora chiangmaiensis TaxID=402650 RepID=UPI00036A31C9|nr:SHOCT domain-containing protein [Actinomycetospora chiangmaiensis]